MPAEKVGEEKQSRRRRLPLAQRSKVQESPEPVVAASGKGRATPSRRRIEAADASGNIVTRTGGGLVEYLAGVQSELKKVAWPTWDEAFRLTIVVLATLIASAIVLGIISAAFTELFRIGLSSPAVLFAFMAVALVGGYVIYRANRRAY